MSNTTLNVTNVNSGPDKRSSINHQSCDAVILLYDGDCPLCRNFSAMLRIRKSVGELRLINAREPNAYLDNAISRGMDVNEGIVLIIGQEFYFAADALNMLALISGRVSIFNKMNYWVFKSKLLSNLLYPILRTGRNMLLKIRGKSKMKHPF